MNKKKKLIITSLLLICFIVIQKLYYHNVVSLGINLILLIVMFVICKIIINPKKPFPSNNDINEITEEDTTLYQSTSHEISKEKSYPELDEEERREKNQILKKVFKISPIVLIILFLLVLSGKYDMEYIEFWLTCMFLVLIFFLKPREEQIKILKKNILTFIDIIAYTAIILVIILVLLKYVFKII